MAYDKSVLVAKTNELRAKITKMREEYKAEVQVAFSEVAKDFFDNTPLVEGVHWTQYTPHWNDGEECNFGVNEIANWIRGEDPDDDPWANGDIGINTSSWGKPTTVEDLKELDIDVTESELEDAKTNLQSFIAFIQAIDDDTMEDMFGDHVHVFVTRDGVKTEEHDHD